MISKSFASIAALILLSTVAHAGSAPKELYGKSISVAWSESGTGKLRGEQIERNFGHAEQMSIYISTAGRPFIRAIGTGIGGLSYHSQSSGTRSQSSESAPGQSDVKDHVDFQGRSIVVYREFDSGARRIAIDLEGTSCKAAVMLAHQAGSKLVSQSGPRGVLEASSIQVGTVSCSIKEGNVFGQ
jgi:hypothetical protein